MSGIFSRAEIPGYQLLELVGEGSNGCVVKARQLATERTVAIKFLKPDLLDEGQRGKQRLIGEAKLLSAISHRNVIQVLGAGLGTESPYVITEFVDGITLAELIEKERVLPLNQFYVLFRQLCAGLKHAHDNHIIHRDLKPRNIMVFGSPDGEQLKILDFGIAKVNTDDKVNQGFTGTGGFVGSPTYMSPEQFINGAIDHRTDIYALGCIAYECLTGAPPFEGDQLFELMYRKQNEVPPTLCERSTTQQIPAFLSNLVASCLERSPDRRPANVEDILIALDKHADTMSRVVQIQPKAKPLMMKAAAIVTVIGVIGAISAWSYTLRRSPSVWTPLKKPTINTVTGGKRLSLHEQRDPIELLVSAQDQIQHCPVSAYGEGTPAVLTPDWNTRLTRARNEIDKALSLMKSDDRPLGLQAYLVKAKLSRVNYAFTHDPKDIEEAISCCKKSLTYATVNGVVCRKPAEATYRFLAEMYSYKKDYQQAYEVFRQALNLNRTLHPESDFEISSQLAGGDSDREFYIMFRMSECLFCAGQHDRAVRELEKSLDEWLKGDNAHRINLNSALAINELANWYHAQGKNAKYRKLIDWGERLLDAEEADPRTRIDAVGLRAIIARTDIISGDEGNGIRLMRSAFDRLKSFSTNLSNVSYDFVNESVCLFSTISPERQKKWLPQIQELRDKLSEAKRSRVFPE